MRDALAPGKLPPSLMAELLRAGPALPPELRLGPAPGEDACAIDVPAGTLVAATDPITLTGAEVGAHAVVINANDVAVMGVRPRWFLAVVLLPLGTGEDEVRALFDSMRRSLAELDAALVGGHTEVTAAVTQPVVVGQMLGLATTGRFVRTGGARPGDVILQVGPAPVEAAAVLAAEAAPRLESLPVELLERAREAVTDPGISVVDAALLAAELGATALHDPTEGGLATGLHELADASGVRLQLREEHIAWFEPGVAVCGALAADPWGALASGCLLAAFDPAAAEAACRDLEFLCGVARPIANAGTGSGIALSSGKTLPRFERDEVARVLAG